MERKEGRDGGRERESRTETERSKGGRKEGRKRVINLDQAKVMECISKRTVALGVKHLLIQERRKCWDAFLPKESRMRT